MPPSRWSLSEPRKSASGWFAAPGLEPGDGGLLASKNRFRFTRHGDSIMQILNDVLPCFFAERCGGT